MELIKGVKSQTKPEKIDDTSSDTTIYIRDNIVESEEIDPVFGTKHTVYTYDEKQYTYQEWVKIISDTLGNTGDDLQTQINTTQLAVAEILSVIYGADVMTLSMDNNEDTDFSTKEGEAILPEEISNEYSAITKLYCSLINKNLFRLEDVPSEFLNEVKKYLEENK